MQIPTGGGSLQQIRHSYRRATGLLFTLSSLLHDCPSGYHVETATATSFWTVPKLKIWYLTPGRWQWACIHWRLCIRAVFSQTNTHTVWCENQHPVNVLHGCAGKHHQGCESSSKWEGTTSLHNPYITPSGVGRLNDNILKQQYGEIVMLCDLAPPTISECNTTVVNTDLRSVTMC